MALIRLISELGYVLIIPMRTIQMTLNDSLMMEIYMIAPAHSLWVLVSW